MKTLTNILQKAKQRAQAANLPYAGALTPQEAQQVLQMTSSARLVDVRSRAELDLVGKIPHATHHTTGYWIQRAGINFRYFAG